MDDKTADKLLSRCPSEEYIREWTELVKKGKPAVEQKRDKSLLMFRIQGEWLALATEVFSKVTEKKFVHTLPQRTSKILLGV
ncbi:MAG: chemotaxis protein CheW, partial [Chlamydiia bacterium]|nr:chemotaxis protein CheW [Chlamydiia bacterium]